MVYTIFLIFAQHIDCGYSLQSPKRDSSSRYPQSVLSRNRKKIMSTSVNPSFTV